MQFVTFHAGTTQACTNIQIIDDAIALEGNETFGIELTPLFQELPVNISTAVVTIIDDDC